MARAANEDKYLDSIRADIKVLRNARKMLVSTDNKTEKTAKALDALDRKMQELLCELTQVRGYQPRLIEPEPHRASA